MLALMLSIPKHRRSTFLSVKCLSAAAVLVGLLVAGCGGSYTRADFIQRADGICTGTTRQIRLLRPPQFGATTVLERRSSARYLIDAAELVKQEARRLSALPRPPENASQRRLRSRWLAEVHSSATELLALASATSTDDAAAMSSAEGKLAANPVVKLAGEYGARACAGPGATYR